jgi:hypothetical protein
MDRSSRSLFVWASISVVCATSALAQGDLRSRLRPISAPVRHGGVYHVATGTWTRGGSMANLTGPDVIYDNTCASGGYVSGQITSEKWQHRSRVPSPTGPTTPSLFYGAPRNDEAPGCRTSYLVNGFQIGYCSQRPSGLGTIDYLFEFADSYTACGATDMVPAQSFAVTGLPGGTSTGGQNCWVMDIDLDGMSTSFVMQADGDGSYTGPSSVETFGYSQGPTTPGITTADVTGPIIAGNFTWTGGGGVGALTPCTGTDGTIWESPVNLAEEGTGMASQDFFRITGMTSVPQGAGCYFFGFQPHADFHLQLYSDADCPGGSPMVQTCLPGQGGVIPCPCGNPPAGGGLGCNNFGDGPAQSGTLDATGVASLAADTVVLNVTGLNNRSLTIFWTGEGVIIQASVIHGAGVRCLSSNLKRLYVGEASGGAISRPQLGDPSVSARTAALGAAIGPGELRHYFNLYRDPFAAGPCGDTAARVNLTNGGRITWGP